MVYLLGLYSLSVTFTRVHVFWIVSYCLIYPAVTLLLEIHFSVEIIKAVVNCCASVCVQFVLHNVVEPRPVDPDFPIIITEVPKQKISLVPFISAVRKLRYIHIHLLYVWGITLSHDDIVSLVCSFCTISYCFLNEMSFLYEGLESETSYKAVMGNKLKKIT